MDLMEISVAESRVSRLMHPSLTTVCRQIVALASDKKFTIMRNLTGINLLALYFHTVDHSIEARRSYKMRGTSSIIQVNA